MVEIEEHKFKISPREGRPRSWDRHCHNMTRLGRDAAAVEQHGQQEEGSVVHQSYPMSLVNLTRIPLEVVREIPDMILILKVGSTSNR